MRMTEMKDNTQTLFASTQNIHLNKLIMDAVDYIDDDLFIEVLEMSASAADVSSGILQQSLLGNRGGLQADDFENHLPEEETSNVDCIGLDRLMMGSVDYLDDDLFVDLLEESYKPVEKNTTEAAIESRLTFTRPEGGNIKRRLELGKKLIEMEKERVQRIKRAEERVERIVAEHKSMFLRVLSAPKQADLDFIFPTLPLLEMDGRTDFRSATKDFEKYRSRQYYIQSVVLLELSKASNDFKRRAEDEFKRELCTNFLLEDKFVKAFDIPRSIPWKKTLAQCDGNTYLTNSYMGKDYIKTYDIMSSFICVPQKAHNGFDMAKITVKNENINSITVPSTIELVYMVVDCCSELVDISFMDFTFKKNSKSFNTFWIEILNCEKLKYIRFPTGTYSISKLLVKDCKSLESIYFPGEVAGRNKNNIFLDRRSCPQVSIVSDDDSMREYAEETDTPIRSVAIG